jgi:hypothetical protein
MAETPAPEPSSEQPPPIPHAPFRRPARPEPLTAGSLVGKTIRIWVSTLPQLLAVAALVHVPRFAVTFYFQTRTPSPTLTLLAEAFQKLELLLTPAFLGVFAVYFVFQRLRGERADLGRSVALGVRRIGTSLGITLLFAAPLIAVVFMTQRTTAELRSGSVTPGSIPTGTLLLVLLLTLVCNVIFALVFQAALPAAVVEKLGVFAALGRSARLTSGRRVTIFFANFLFGILSAFIVGPVVAITTFSGGATTTLVTTSAMYWVMGSLYCVFPIVLYHELRRTKEGFGIDELAKAFD